MKISLKPLFKICGPFLNPTSFGAYILSMRSLDRLSLQLSAYGKTLGSLLGHAFSRYRNEIIVILLMSLAGVIGQLVGLGLIFTLAKAMETGRAIEIPGADLSVQLSPETLAGFAGAVFLVMTVSGFFHFAAYRRAVRIGCRFEESLIRKTIEEESKRPIAWASVEEGSGALKKRVIKDARCCNRILFLLVANMVDALFFLVIGAFAFWFDWFTTGVILTILLLYAARFYKVNLRGARSSLALELLSPLATREKLNVLKRLERTITAIEETDPELDHIFRAGASGKFISVYEERIAVVPAAQLLSNLFGSLVISGTLLLFGLTIFFQGGSWSKLVTYLLALRLLVGKLSKLASAITAINSIYPHARRFFNGRAQSTERVALRTASGVYSHGPVLSLDGKNKEFVLKRGELVALLYDGEFGRSLAALVTQLKGAEDVVEVSLVTIPVYSDRRLLGQALGIDEPGNCMRIEDEISRMGYGKAYKTYLPQGMSTKVVDISEGEERDLLMILLGVLAAKSRSTDLILIDGGYLLKLRKDIREQTLRGMNHRLVIVHLPNERLLAALDDDCSVLVFDGQKVIGWASSGRLRAHAGVLGRQVGKYSVAANPDDREMDDQMI